jgi:hypothetical protein
MRAMTNSTPRSQIERGIASMDQVASVIEGRFDGGPADRTRFIDIAPDNGLHVRVLPDRGFDIAHAWHDGVQIAWLSKVGMSGPAMSPHEMEWLDFYSGGLVVTCGFDNVGAPSEGVGLHGSFSHLRAPDVSVTRKLDDEQVRVIACATISDVSALGRRIEIRRTITTTTGTAELSIVDEAHNLGNDREPSPVLYHVNLGPPVWQPGSRVEISSDRVVARDHIGEGPAADGGWASAPEPNTSGEELVFEHVGHDSVAVVSDARSERTVTISWDGQELPRLFQWVHPQRSVYALGIEPTNASVKGRATDRADGVMPFLEPGQTQRSGVRIVVD